MNKSIGSTKRSDPTGNIFNNQKPLKIAQNQRNLVHSYLSKLIFKCFKVYINHHDAQLISNVAIGIYYAQEARGKSALI